MTINIYPLARNILFNLEAERAHHLGLKMLKATHALHLSSLLFGKPIYSPVKVMGIEFPNPIGLAAGLDKNGDYFAALSACGFGFVEIGTVTPRPQPGNPQPRIVRLPPAHAIINRMGFNNQGVDYLLQNVVLVQPFKPARPTIGTNRVQHRVRGANVAETKFFVMSSPRLRRFGHTA